jgi:hypothetical protein
MSILAPISAGELVDKITILRVKAQRIGDPAKEANVRKELALLEATAAEHLPDNADIARLTAELTRSTPPSGTSRTASATASAARTSARTSWPWPAASISTTTSAPPSSAPSTKPPARRSSRRRATSPTFSMSRAMTQVVRGAREMVAGMTPALQSGEYVFCAAGDRDWATLQPLAMFREAEGVSLILERGAALAAGFPVEAPMALITLNVYSALDGVGLTAAVATAYWRRLGSPATWSRR